MFWEHSSIGTARVDSAVAVVISSKILLLEIVGQGNIVGAVENCLTQRRQIITYSDISDMYWEVRMRCSRDLRPFKTIQAVLHSQDVQEHSCLKPDKPLTRSSVQDCILASGVF